MKKSLVLVLLLSVVFGTPVRGTTARSWSASTGDAFGQGTLDGTAIDAQGRVRLAPTVETLWGPEDGIVWDVEGAGLDGAFVGLSGPGRVLRVAAGAEPETWFRSEEEGLVTALAAEQGGGVWVGSSPDGRVHLARGAAHVQTVVETGATFVWSLATDPAGALWIGTGLPGKLLRRSAAGELETLFETGDDPVRSLVALEEGGVVLGTGGRGRVIRVGADGEAFVLLDAEESEVVALAALEGGTIFALTASPKQPARPRSAEASTPSGATERVRVTAPAPAPRENGRPNGEAQPARSEEKRPARPFRSIAGGTLYRIDADGSTLALWKTSNEIPFAMQLTPAGELLVATGDSGRVWAVNASGEASLLLRVPSNQVSAMARGAGDRVLLGGTTDARVVLVGPGCRSSGAYLTPPVDAQSVADWGRLNWDAELPRGTRLAVQVRAGNTAEPDETWSDWASLRASSGGSGVVAGLPPARWFQARFDLLSRDGASPALSRFEVFFRPRNRAPEIEAFSVEPAGTVWTPGPTQSSSRLGPLVADDPVARSALQRLRAGRRNGPIRKGYEAGARTFHWKVSDPDGDRLSFAVDLRLEGARHWFPLSLGLEQPYLSWDARSLPDGIYRARLRASDASDNPDGGELTAERVSDAFRVDNTRPGVGGLSIEPVEGGRHVAFVASDPGGSVAAVEVAMDGGDWQALDPLDGVADSEQELYELTIGPAGALDPRALRVRVSDGAGNLGGQLWLIEEP